MQFAVAVTRAAGFTTSRCFARLYEMKIERGEVDVEWGID